MAGGIAKRIARELHPGSQVVYELGWYWAVDTDHNWSGDGGHETENDAWTDILKNCTGASIPDRRRAMGKLLELLGQ